MEYLHNKVLLLALYHYHVELMAFSLLDQYKLLQLFGSSCMIHEDHLFDAFIPFELTVEVSHLGSWRCLHLLHC